MQAQVYEGYFKNGNFYAAGRTIRIPDDRRIYITIPDEPAQENKEKSNTWAELDNIVSTMDIIPRFEDFPRCQLGREQINFNEV